jgi:hypothetical protein
MAILSYWEVCSLFCHSVILLVTYYIQEYQETFPRVFRGALTYLAIQGTEVPCEWAFSVGKDATTDRLNRLKADTVEALLMLQFSLRRANSISFTAGTDRDLEIIALEQLNGRNTCLPEDPFLYKSYLEGGDA